MTSRSVVFAEPARTAIGTFGGSLKDVPAPALGATAIRAAVGRAGIRPDEVETVVMGNVVQAGTKTNSARQAAVHAGLPVTTPALTVNRVCGSGAQAIVSAAQEIALGNIDAAVAETGVTSLKQMGVVMKAAQAKLSGKTVDGKALSEKVRSRLQ